MSATVAITGASGLIGSALTGALEAAGRRTLRLVRRPPRSSNEVGWDPAADSLDRAALSGVDAVVHLAGENLASGRWTPERKRRLHDSRVLGTRLIAEAIAASAPAPAVLVSASAVGYYGDRGDTVVTEDDGVGAGFLARLAEAWEQATRPAADRGVRTVLLRFGVVLTPSGGMLQRVLPVFRLGLGGTLGAGCQWMSWITLRDLLRVVETALGDGRYAGPMNCVSPNPVTNAEFTQALGRALRRPTLLAVPPVVLELVFGQMAREALLSSTRAHPARLLAAGFEFADPVLGPAFDRMLRD